MDHTRSSVCPGCKQDCSLVAVVDLVYTFERCTCEVEQFPHLVQTAWHKDCYLLHEVGKVIEVAEELVGLTGPLYDSDSCVVCDGEVWEDGGHHVTGCLVDELEIALMMYKNKQLSRR